MRFHAIFKQFHTIFMQIFHKTFKLSYLKGVSRSEVDGNEGEPDDASRVHREADELGLVEVLGNLKWNFW